MAALASRFLRQTQRITAQIHYFLPLEPGQAPIRINGDLLIGQSREVRHRNILQTFVFQTDDAPDIKNPRLAEVFERLVVANQGIVRIQDRLSTASITPQDLPPDSKPYVLPILIPRPVEEVQAGMKETVDTFEAMVPFPKFRKFLQFWQEKIDGPLHEVQFMMPHVSQVGWRKVDAEMKFN